MFKVLIVDDEAIIRKGLKNIIDWKSLDCEICGDACDGIDGMNKIREYLPDIVITDINMPEVDGLKMVRETKQIIPKGKIIILTGYRDFEYIQEAIRLGALDYVLKPSKIEDITAVVKKATTELRLQNKLEEDVMSLKKQFESKIPILKQKLLCDLIFTTHLKKDAILEELALYQVKINDFFIMIVENDEEEALKTKSQYERQLYQFGIVNTFEEILSESFKVINIPLVNKSIVFIVQPARAGQDVLMNRLYQDVTSLQELVRNCFNFTITISISTMGNGPFQLAEKTKEALEALEYKFYLGKNSIILYEDLKSFYRSSDLSLLEEDQRLLIQNIKSGNEKNVRQNLSDIVKNINECTMDRESIRIFYWNMINVINSIPSALQSTEGKNLGDLFKKIEQCDCLEELNRYLEILALEAAQKIKSFNQKSINSTLRKAVSYINQKFSEEITLNEVAEHTYVSTYYLSRMFTKEMGKNFIDYLNEVRIEKAKAYLKDTNYKAYEIAELVGIKDAHYFSKLFKKYVGTTPSEYKSNL